MRKIKILLTSLLLNLPIFSICQSPKINNIQEVKQLNIYGNNNKTVIGKVLINETLDTKVYLLAYEEKTDTIGNYITILKFGNNEKVPLFGTDIVLQFDSPVISVNPQIASVAMSEGWGYNADKTAFEYKAGQLNRPYEGNTILTLTILSKKKIFTTIHGIEGILKN